SPSERGIDHDDPRLLDGRSIELEIARGREESHRMPALPFDPAKKRFKHFPEHRLPLLRRGDRQSRFAHEEIDPIGLETMLSKRMRSLEMLLEELDSDTDPLERNLEPTTNRAECVRLDEVQKRKPQRPL